jgi:hypothetical protein
MTPRFSRIWNRIDAAISQEESNKMFNKILAIQAEKRHKRNRGQVIGNLILTTVICIVIFWIFMALRPANAGAYNPMRSCGWSITAACAAVRNGGSYTREGITHRFVGRYPNGAIHIHVYRGNARVK